MNARQAPSGAFAPPPTGLFGRIGRWLRSRPLRAAAALLVLPLTTLAAVVAVTAPAQAAVGAVGAADPVNGFPAWYEDAAGNRVEPCIDTADANCILGAVPGVFNPQNPVVFPDNFPDEFFYAFAESTIQNTPGCSGTAAGKASVRLALEGAFANGNPAPGEQMVFGRIRVKVTSGLCPTTRYRFSHPFGDVFLTTNAAGAIPATVGTVDVGCLPVLPQTCNFAQALNSPVLGSQADGGFLRSVAAPAGYLGDGATPTAITGGIAANNNSFHIYAAPAGQAEVDTTIGTDQFVVAGKLAGPLTAAPLDFAGVDLASPDPAPDGTPAGVSAPKTVTVKNLSNAPITVTSVTNLTGPDAADFAVTGTTCNDGVNDVTLNRDETCTFTVTFSPTGAVPGLRTASLDIQHSGGIRSPLQVALVGHATTPGAAATADSAPASLAFGDVRLRTISGVKTVTISNNGDAPLVVSDVQLTNSGTGSGSAHYSIATNNCLTGSIAAGASCSVGVRFAPLTDGLHQATLQVVTSVGTRSTPVSGTGTGGVAAVSPTFDNQTGFPEWYRDETGAKLTECIDPNDPYCIVLPDDFYTAGQPLSFLDGSPARDTLAGPINFPTEFFYTVTDSDQIQLEACPTGGDAGTAFIRMALEGAFTGDPTPLEQMVFGRIRIVVRGGLCADTDYKFIHPYGETILHTDDAGSIKPAAGTEDVGCAPVAPDVCEFDLALTSRIFGGFLRWDPAVAPAAPPGYMGDAVSFHKIVGAPYEVDGNPVNFFKVTTMDDELLGETDQFTVMGKLRGPLEVEETGGVNNGKVDFGAQPMGSATASQTITYTNNGVAVPALGTDGSIVVDGTSLTGVDAADFQVTTDNCAGQTLQIGDSCSVDVAFNPGAIGNRSATLLVTHSGLNSPTPVPLLGIGGANGALAALSFQPRSVTFAPLQQSRTSSLQTVVVSNAGGNLPLTFHNPAVIAGASSASFGIVEDRCFGTVVNPGNSCEIDIAFTPQAAGAVSAVLRTDDNAPGAPHDLPLSGTGVSVPKNVSATTDPNGFPNWYQDDNGTRLEPCLSTAEPCVVLGDAGFNPANPVVFPSNFPEEFFYAVSDSEILNTPGCPAFGIAPGTAMLRVGLEGSFAVPNPTAGQQITFTRVRVILTGGLCPNTTYNFATPYGLFPFQTDGNGTFGRNAGTQDTGCGAAPCTFADALASPGTVGPTPIEGFLRWDPNVAPAAPEGFLGDAVSFHKVVGGTYIPQFGSTPVNKFEIYSLAGGAPLASTDKFTVSGKIAGPLQTNNRSLAFGHQPMDPTGVVGTAPKTVTVTNVFAPGVTFDSIAPTGVGAGQFKVVTDANPGTCGNHPLALDETCTVQVTFNPTSLGNKSATLRVATTQSPNRPLLVSLTGTGDAALAPAIAAAPGVLSFGTVTYPGVQTATTVISNPGTGDLHIRALTFSTGAGVTDYSRIAGPALTDCAQNPTAEAPIVVPANGGSCTITVRFAPTAIGARSATMTLVSDAASSPTVISLSGSGAASTLTVAGTLSFSNVNLNTTKTLTTSVRNSGTLPFTVGAPTITPLTAGTPANMWTVNPGCVGTQLLPGKSCNLSITFRANGTRGTTYRATLGVRGDATTLPVVTNVALSGTVK